MTVSWESLDLLAGPSPSRQNQLRTKKEYCFPTHAASRSLTTLAGYFARRRYLRSQWNYLGHKRSPTSSKVSFVPDWVKAAVDLWLTSAEVTHGRIFRCVTRTASVWGDGITEKVIWHIVKENAGRAGIAKLSPHDCRRTCARLCHAAGGELEQIQFLLGHVSVETTERYLGCKQRLRSAVNDRIGLEP